MLVLPTSMANNIQASETKTVRHRGHKGHKAKTLCSQTGEMKLASISFVSLASFVSLVSFVSNASCGGSQPCQFSADDTLDSITDSHEERAAIVDAVCGA